MFHAPESYQNASLQLSEVLNDIGISEKMLMKTRRAYLLQETIETITHRLLGTQDTVYLLGSQSEGTTTIGLQSDLDVLVFSNANTVIQDWAEWSPRKGDLMMIKDDTTPPGYCYLQDIKSDVPLPCTEEHDNNHGKDTHGRVLLKNTAIDDILKNRQREGPSLADEGGPGMSATDLVCSIPFKSLPLSVRHWLDQEHSVWPTAKMKRYAATSDCLVVATGSSVSENKDFQWRISTSLAERCFMFNLNITQIRCYILLKMILQTFINLNGQKHITSYMCKTVLLHCVRSKPSYEWKENNILNCLIYCLSTLNHCILCGNCPHFIIPENNLMAGKISAENRCWLREKISNLIRHTVDHLVEIQSDDLGQRLFLKLYIIPDVDYNAVFYFENIARSLLDAGYRSFNTTVYFEANYKNYLLSLNNRSFEEQVIFLLQTIVNLVQYHHEENVFVQAACRYGTPFYCTTLGSLMASNNILHNNPVSPQALEWFSAGINSDVSSSRLKIASVFFCADDMVRAALILRCTEERYNVHVVEPVCHCYTHPPVSAKIHFCVISSHYNEDALKYITARCVRFLHTEINCIPKDQLLMVTLREENLGHRETAWNLLGQCMEQENRLNDAFQCYRNSMHVRQSNNVAIIHICRLLASLVRLAREN